jgi:adenine deaminase
MTSFTLTGNIIDIKSRNIYWGELEITEGFVTNIKEISEEKNEQPYLLPGFIDSHVHIESSMLVPSEFARLAVVHGTVGTISDPHEIANVCGFEGVKYMIENGNTVPFKFNFGAPSCVPATIFETAGAAIDSEGVEQLLLMDEIRYLSEMMNFPGVLFEDEEVMKKIALAKKYNKPVDGHAPGLRGSDAKKYIDAGISTDHECFTAEEALDKLSFGMKILIREGSAAKNFEALIELMHAHFENMMFCSDDKHPDSLADGHINQLCARAVAKGIDVFKVLQAACINPVEHYKMNVGIMQIGDPADFILIKNLTHFEVLKTYINGKLVAENGKSFLNPNKAIVINQFNCDEKQIAEFKFLYNGENKIPVIEALEGQLITNKIFVTPKVYNNEVVADVENDILKIVVVNRYYKAPIAKSFIKNIGIKKGALASSVAHDSHNIVAVGVDDESICKAVNAVIRSGGGVSAVSETEEKILALPVAGLMSTENGYEVAKFYTEIDTFVKTNLGSHLHAPFMTLSFMALLVIPHLKLSDKGLFDGDNFKIII